MPGRVHFSGGKISWNLILPTVVVRWAQVVAYRSKGLPTNLSRMNTVLRSRHNCDAQAKGKHIYRPAEKPSRTTLVSVPSPSTSSPGDHNHNSQGSPGRSRLQATSIVMAINRITVVSDCLDVQQVSTNTDEAAVAWNVPLEIGAVFNEWLKARRREVPAICALGLIANTIMPEAELALRDCIDAGRSLSGVATTEDRY